MAGVTNVTSLKWKREDATSTNYKYCLFCQESNTGQLMSASCEGKKRVKDVALERARLKDTSYTFLLECFESITEEDWNNAENVKWHKICYSKFAAENKLQRLRNKGDRENKHLNITPDKDNEQFTGSRTSHGTCYAVKWNLCIFCQSGNVVNLCQVATFALSEKNNSLLRT